MSREHFDSFSGFSKGILMYGACLHCPSARARISGIVFFRGRQSRWAWFPSKFRQSPISPTMPELSSMPMMYACRESALTVPCPDWWKMPLHYSTRGCYRTVFGRDWEVALCRQVEALQGCLSGSLEWVGAGYFSCRWFSMEWWFHQRIEFQDRPGCW